MIMRIYSLIARFFGFIVFRLIPVLVIVAIVWSGYQVAQAVVRQVDERSAYQERVETFGDVATRVALDRQAAAVTATPSATPTDLPTATATLTETPEPTETAEPTATPSEEPDTPEPTSTQEPTNTQEPSATATATATLTETPEPTETEARELLQATATGSSLIFATNTPRPLIFATNTPVQAQVIPTATEEPVPSVTPETATDVPVPPTEVVSAQPTPTNTLPPFYFPRTVEPGRVINGVSVPTEVPLIPRESNLFNVVLLGGDDQITNDGTVRTDTMIVVSINRDTGTVSMLSLPRDLLVYLPTESGALERLNTVYGYGQSIGWQPEPFDLLRQTLAYNFGINVHHFALVNFSGFESIIDTLGGVNIAVDCAYQDYRLIGAELPAGATASTSDDDLFTIDVGYYNMSGSQALWYARTRRSSTDFDRGRRQQQILRAMYRKALDTGQLRNLPQLWGQVTGILRTSVDVSDVFGLVPLALELDASSIRSYTLILGYHTQPITVTGTDGVSANVHVPVYETLRVLLEDFYRPPANNQIAVEGATIAIYNGTGNEDWDLVAAERLGWEGFGAIAMGDADARDYSETILIDHTGQQKGSSLNQIAAVLNVRPENIRIEPDPNRVADFEVYLGSAYNSCTFDGILPPEE